ncbi:Bug family tripartite tricarboxylate transporter substrate binding protein [Ottowia thiooxydans]|uniref:Bug family tripartite tricarboxylate transporter substrate binding protein n=1 Tax=Ottowia thiooxydans TaxID=219182 RepID=UPI00041322FE|nr:tripartite tricarboxylate transporter substrate binding protein [Ottowia thiooxydans]
MKRRLLSMSLVLGTLSMSFSAWAQYPERPVKLIVPFAPGGGTDIVGRLVAENLSQALKQTVLVENKPGAGAMLGADFVARALPDGYTLLMGTSAELTIGPKLTPANAKYNPVMDFVPIALVGTSPNVLLTNSGFSSSTVPEIITFAQANPEKLSYGSGGTGTGPHLSGELIKSMGKFQMVHVPYKGSGPALTDLIAGQTQLVMSTMAPALPFIKGNRVRPIAVTSTKRSPLLPNTPTVAEQGLKGYEAVTWYAVLAPAGTPKESVVKLQTAISQVLRRGDVVERLATLGVEVPQAVESSSSLQERIRRELDQWETLIRDSNIKAE